MDRFRLIVLDGTSKSDKKRAAAALAKRLDFVHVHSGWFFAAIAEIVAKTGATGRDAATLLDVRGVRLEDPVGSFRTEIMRTLEDHHFVRNMVACVVRGAVWFSKAKGAVITGRAGVDEFPEADRKFFLTGNLTERARRLADSLPEGYEVNHEAMVSEVRQRDAVSMGSLFFPLARHPQSPPYDLVVDNTSLSTEEVDEALLDAVSGVLS